MYTPCLYNREENREEKKGTSFCFKGAEEEEDKETGSISRWNQNCYCFDLTEGCELQKKPKKSPMIKSENVGKYILCGKSTCTGIKSSYKKT